MATALSFNLYQNYNDRGAFVQQGIWQQTELDESFIHEGERLPQWPGYEDLIVTLYIPGERIELDNAGKTVIIHAGEEVLIGTSLFNQSHGVDCTIYKCIRML